MISLFQSEPIIFHLPDAEIIYYPQFFNKNESDNFFSQLTNEIPWLQEDIKIFGKIHPQPRLTALYGNEGKSYSYSSIKMQPHPWNQILQKIKSDVEDAVDENFTTVLLNYYRDGKDSNGWHADNGPQQ
jgi:alkylated DNA repair dioxygenase AlkB